MPADVLVLLVVVPVLVVVIGVLYSSKQTRDILIGIGNVLSLLRPW